MPHRPWIWAAAAALTACSAEVTEVQLDRIDFDYAFAVFLDGDGHPVRLGPVFGRLDEAPFGANALVHREGEQSVLLVTLTDEQLTAAIYDFDPARALELAVELVSPPPTPTFVSLSGIRPPARRAALPAEAGYYLAPLDGRTQDAVGLELTTGPDERIQSAITLIVPVNPEFCRRAGQTPLSAFAADPAPITRLRNAPPQLSQVQDLIWLDVDTVLVVGFNELYIVRRDQPWVDNRDSAYRLPRDERFRYRRFHEGDAEARASDGTWTVWISGGFPGEEAPGTRRFGAHGALWRVTVGPEGLRAVQTSTETPGLQMWTVHVSADGTVLAGGDAGLLLQKQPGADRFVRRPSRPVARTEPGKDWVSTIASFDVPAVRWVVGTQGILHEYDAARGRWTERSVIADVVTSPELFEFFALDGRPRGPDDVELWAAASRGGIVRRIGRSARWNFVQPSFPPRFEGCASAAGPDDVSLTVLKAINDLVIQDGFVHLAVQNCNAVVMLRLAEDPSPGAPPGCVSLLTEADVFPGFSPAEYTAMAARPGELLVLRGDGRLLRSTWDP